MDITYIRQRSLGNFVGWVRYNGRKKLLIEVTGRRINYISKYVIDIKLSLKKHTPNIKAQNLST